MSCSSHQVQSYGIPFLAEFRRQATDRNRTSPIAFTGNKFEFRAVGASHNPSWSTTVLNTITADSLAFLDGEIQRLIRSGKSAADATRTVIADTLTKHERVIFDGNGYAPERQTEAAKRGQARPAQPQEHARCLPTLPRREEPRALPFDSSTRRGRAAVAPVRSLDMLPIHYLTHSLTHVIVRNL